MAEENAPKSELGIQRIHHLHVRPSKGLTDGCRADTAIPMWHFASLAPQK